ncbi:alanyl-tRNA editing protein [Thermoproteota archaeon]
MKKLFWQDPYIKECEATVTSKMGPEIQLDQTIFFAFSGGQASDQGTINGIKVIDAMKSDDNITYILESVPDFNEGDKVKVVIDWENRFKLMRLHSAAHIVFHMFEDKTGLKNLIGSNITPDKARLDYATDNPISELLPEIESKTNEITSKDAEIKTYDDDSEPGKRWWEIEGLGLKDACGGTHVRNTNEIGLIKLKRKNIGAGKERIEISLV